MADVKNKWSNMQTKMRYLSSLRGNCSPNIYMHILIGVIYIKHLNINFDANFSTDDSVENRNLGYAWLPPQARWVNVRKGLYTAKAAKLLDDTLDLIETHNPSLIGLSKKVFVESNLRSDVLVEIFDILDDITIEDFKDVDVIGWIYEYFLSKFKNEFRNLHGEFFTPSVISKLVYEICMRGRERVNRVYDPTCGTGSLLLHGKKFFDASRIEYGFFGQELNETTFNFARMNMLLQNIPFDKFQLRNDDTIYSPHFMGDNEKFDVIVSNPPYSVSWRKSSDKSMINDKRFAEANVLPPSNYGDYAFILHCLNRLSDSGKAAIVCFPGVLYRQKEEEIIRKFLIVNNYVETVINIPENAFYSTKTPTVILVLNKNKTNNMVQFINIDSELLFSESKSDEDRIEYLGDVYESKEDIEFLSKSVTPDVILGNNFNLNVKCYVDTKSTARNLSIKELSNEAIDISNRIRKLSETLVEVIM